MTNIHTNLIAFVISYASFLIHRKSFDFMCLVVSSISPDATSVSCRCKCASVQKRLEPLYRRGGFIASEMHVLRSCNSQANPTRDIVELPTSQRALRTCYRCLPLKPPVSLGRLYPHARLSSKLVIEERHSHLSLPVFPNLPWIEPSITCCPREPSSEFKTELG